MNEDEQFLGQVLSEIAEAEIITIFFPLLRRALVVDTRSDGEMGHLIKVMPQVRSMEERISSIQKLRPSLGKVHSILGIPWMKSVRGLREHGVRARLIERLASSGVPLTLAEKQISEALEQLWRLERLGFERMIRGEGYTTIWAASGQS
ncbi:MAG TPA: hypothetical protein VM409_06970 [Chloroflexia bacterium]|nr:hypothetical protein [Chloroflexia bacterium]